MKYNYRIFYMHFSVASITEILIALAVFKFTTITIPFYVYFGVLLYNIFFALIINKHFHRKYLRKILRQRKSQRIKENEEFLRSRFPSLGHKYKSYMESD